MGLFFWKKKDGRISPEELVLMKLKDLLFPKMQVKELQEDDGTVTRYLLDCSIDSALNMVLSDLEDGYSGIDTQKNINVILKKLFLVRKLLKAEEVVFPRGVETIVVSCEEREING